MMNLELFARSASTRAHRIALSLVVSAMTLPSASLVAQQRAPATPALQRLVTLDVRDVPLKAVLDEVDRQATLGLTYSLRIVPVAKRVSIRVSRVTAGEALTRVLAGTDIVAELTSAGMVMLVRRGGSETTQPAAAGAVFGVVTDSATGEPVPNAIVSVKGTTIRAASGERGQYGLRDIPSGPRVITARLLGYLLVEKDVTVVDDRPARLDFALSYSPSRLQEVVMTATGPRRRLELGSDITILNADSIVATQPISSVTDLLEGRVPGLVVQRSSGAPGDPARLRLRGASSPLLSNDPIVIVDGVRVYSEQSNARGANLAGSGTDNVSGLTPYAAPSPLDYIDPNSIETIEVLKGPSAVTLYGQDAANGVIVIATKKGRPGPARWTVSADRGQTQLAGSYPQLYISWGHLVAQNTPVICPVNNRVGGRQTNPSCQADSLVTYQMLSDPELTVLDRGNRSAMTLGVSGGSSTLTYQLTGSFRDEVGLIKLPTFEAERYQELRGTRPPDWMQRPQSLTQGSGSSRITAQLGATADVSLTTSLSRTAQQRSSLERWLGAFMSVYVDRASGTYYVAGFDGSSLEPTVSQGFPPYFERATAEVTQFTNGINLNWRPVSWLTTTADAGLNVIQRADEIFLPPAELTGSDSAGSLKRGQGSSVVNTVNFRARAQAPLGRGFQFQFATGLNYTGRSIADLNGEVHGLAEGTESVNNAAEIRRLGESRLDQATYGWYVEPAVSHRRFWLSGGLRLDGGSTFGTRLKLPSFPKLSFSYLVSDEPFFPNALQSVFNTLRLRLGYGHAGRQPGPTDRLRLYGARTPQWGDGEFVNTVVLQTLGNTELKPERSKELEGGFDADLFADRLSLSLTSYRKTTTDALLSVPVAPSVYGEDVSIFTNIGVVRNAGVDLTVGMQPVRTGLVTWGMQLAVSWLRNEVVELAPGVEPFYTESSGATGIRVAPGYPLFGRWTRPILGYADANADGVLESAEVLLGDTAVFVGGTLPNYTANLHTTLSLWRGALAVTAGLLHQDGMTQRNEVARQLAPFSRGWNVPGASLAEQAATLFVDGSEYNWIQTVSTLRFNSLTVTYNVPSALAQRLKTRALSVSLLGSNLGLRTNYRGLDPNVNALPTGNNVNDTGVLPQPRTWQMRVNASF